MQKIIFFLFGLLFLTIVFTPNALAHRYSSSNPCDSDHYLVSKEGPVFVCDDAGSGRSPGSNPLGNITLPGNLEESTKPTNIINSLVGLLISIAGLLFFFYLLIGGIRYMSAGGDAKAVSSATSAITTAAIGFVLVISAYFIALFLGEVFNIQILKPDIPILEGL